MRFLLCALGLAAVAGVARADLTLASGGKARCVLIQQTGATAAERHAAAELARFLGELTGAVFEIRAGADVDNAILVGPGPVAEKHFPDVNWKTLGGETAVLRCRGNRLLLAGGRPRGTLYAVYRFLHDQCGVRWWTPWASNVPRRPELRVADLTVTSQPGFELRDPFWFAAFDGDWAARNGCNGPSARLTERHGGKVLYKGFVHTFYPLVPPDKHFAQHPEWYSLIGGRRKVEHGQLCTTNPQLRAFLTEQVRQWLKQAPEASIVSISQNDWHGACECPNCKALDDREGSHAGTMLALVNHVAGQLGPTHPNVAFDTLAYQYTRKAPKTIRPLPNVIVRLCSIECNFAAPLSDPSNQTFARDLHDWSRLCNRLHIWDYTTNFAHYLLPHPNWYALGPNVRFFHRHGVKGLMEQGAYQSCGAEMAELRAWLLARLLWDPTLDDQKLIREFLEGYYGKAAAAPVEQYLQLMQRAAAGYKLSCFAPPTAPFLRFETLSQAERLWQKAELAARGDPDKVWRVRQGRLAVWYAWLTRWSSLRRECRAAGAEWPLATSRKAVAAEWLAVATGPGPKGWSPVTHVNESGLTPRAFADRFAEDPPDLPKGVGKPEAPADLSATERARGVDIQDDAAVLAREGVWAEARPDRSASDGLAIRLPGSHREWACSFPVEAFPPAAKKGKWKVYAVLRVEPADAAKPEALAFTAGVYDHAARASRGDVARKVREADTRYRSYLLGTVDLRAEQIVWMAPPADPAVKAIWVDRVFLVPAP